MKKINGLMLIGIFLGVVLFSLNIFLLFNNAYLKKNVNDAAEMLNILKKENERVWEQKKGIEKESEKLKADSLSYINLNTTIDKENKDLQVKLKQSQEIIDSKESDIQVKTEQIEALKKEQEKNIGVTIHEYEAEKEKLEQEIEALKKSLQDVESEKNKEKALYHYNLAVAYSNAKMYEDSIAEYEKSLGYEDNNPEAHYNSGLLYENVKKDFEKAVEHYNKYLELKPESDDKKEVKKWINRLSQ